jgi:hypothetical protein
MRGTASWAELPQVRRVKKEQSVLITTFDCFALSLECSTRLPYAHVRWSPTHNTKPPVIARDRINAPLRAALFDAPRCQHHTCT